MQLRARASRAIAALMIIAAAGVQISPAGAVNLRFAHAVPDGEPVHVYLGDRVTFPGVAPGIITPYKNVTTGQNDGRRVVLATVQDGTKHEGIELPVGQDDASLTIVALPGGEAGVEIRILPVQSGTRTSGQSSIVLLNGVPGAEGYDLQVDSQPATSATISGEPSDSVNIDTGQRQITVTDRTGRAVGAPENIVIAPERNYTVIVLGVPGQERVLAFDDREGFQPPQSEHQIPPPQEPPSEETTLETTATVEEESAELPTILEPTTGTETSP